MFIAGQEQFVLHDAVAPDQVFAGPWHPVHHLMIFRDIRIEYSKRTDHLAAGIRQQWKFDLVRFAEVTEYFLRIVSDRRCVDSVCGQFTKCVLQLDELVAAIGSPIGAAAENQQQAVRAGEIVQRPIAAGLIG